MPNEEKKENYLDEYIKDEWAERYGFEPIIIDWDKVCDVKLDEEIKGWPDSPMGEKAKSLGLNLRKWRVSCPDPEHGTFNQLIPVEDVYWGKLCKHCISREMKRVFAERFRRYEDMKRRKEA